jgi:hypothetical protein
MSAKQFEHVFVTRAALWEGREVYCCLHLPLKDHQLGKLDRIFKQYGQK